MAKKNTFLEILWLKITGKIKFVKKKSAQTKYVRYKCVLRKYCFINYKQDVSIRHIHIKYNTIH